MGFTAAVLTISDRCSTGEREDTSGPALCAILEERGYNIVHTAVIPDEKDLISEALIQCCDEIGADLVLTTGGTGFARRDVTPEATKAVAERDVPGIPEAMRAESMKITPRGCLSRGMACIRKNSLIINLPGSKKGATENILAVIDPLEHGLKKLASDGSADCAQPEGISTSDAQPAIESAKSFADCTKQEMASVKPSAEEWLKEAKNDPSAALCGMYLIHNGVVRETPRAIARGLESAETQSPAAPTVSGMIMSFDSAKLEAAVSEAKKMPGIHYVRAWVASGRLKVGDDIMQLLVGGDIRSNVLNALIALLTKIKTECVTEKEIIE